MPTSQSQNQLPSIAKFSVLLIPPIQENLTRTSSLHDHSHHIVHLVLHPCKLVVRPRTSVVFPVVFVAPGALIRALSIWLETAVKFPVSVSKVCKDCCTVAEIEVIGVLVAATGNAPLPVEC